MPKSEGDLLDELVMYYVPNILLLHVKRRVTIPRRGRESDAAANVWQTATAWSKGQRNFPLFFMPTINI